MMFAAVLLLTGCGHNAIQYGDGIGFDVGINPNNYMLSLNLRYGKILSAVVRDNVELELSGKADANGMSGDPNTAGASSDGNLKIQIGRQINGATVDLVKAGADSEKIIGRHLADEACECGGIANVNPERWMNEFLGFGDENDLGQLMAAFRCKVYAQKALKEAEINLRKAENFLNEFLTNLPKANSGCAYDNGMIEYANGKLEMIKVYFGE